MSVGGGNWTSQNKILPGTYINFVSATNSNAMLSERGYVALPLALDWGIEDAVFTVTAEDFRRNSLKLFGYEFSHEKLKGLRDLFMHARTLHAFRLGIGSKASCTIAKAKFGGIRGNDLKIYITELTANETSIGFNVKTLFGTTLVDNQDVFFEPDDESIKTNSLKPNDFVDWIFDITLSPGIFNLQNGMNATDITSSYQTFFDKIQSYAFNTLGCLDSTDAIKVSFVEFTKHLRDERGVKFQCVLHKYSADYEGVISVENNASPDLVYWVTGANAGCEINKSLTNKFYDGEFEIAVDYTQNELEQAIQSGKFIFHRGVNGVLVLEDINTLQTLSDAKTADFKSNQIIRVLDQIGNDIAVIFNIKYLGTIPNDNSGRISLWSDIVKHHQALQNLRAIENFSPEDVKIEKGESKKSVIVTDFVTPINAMSQLYMTVFVQ